MGIASYSSYSISSISREKSIINKIQPAPWLIQCSKNQTLKADTVLETTLQRSSWILMTSSRVLFWTPRISLRVSCANVPEGQSIKSDKVKGQKTSACQLTVYSGQLVSQPPCTGWSRITRTPIVQISFFIFLEGLSCGELISNYWVICSKEFCRRRTLLFAEADSIYI